MLANNLNSCLTQISIVKLGISVQPSRSVMKSRCPQISPVTWQSMDIYDISVFVQYNKSFIGSYKSEACWINTSVFLISGMEVASNASDRSSIQSHWRITSPSVGFYPPQLVKDAFCELHWGNLVLILHRFMHLKTSFIWDVLKSTDMLNELPFQWTRAWWKKCQIVI